MGSVVTGAPILLARPSAASSDSVPMPAPMQPVLGTSSGAPFPDSSSTAVTDIGDPGSGVIFSSGGQVSGAGTAADSPIGMAMHDLAGGHLVDAAAEAEYAVDQDLAGGNLTPAIDSAVNAVDQATKPLQNLGNGLLGIGAWVTAHPVLTLALVSGVVLLVVGGPELRAAKRALG